ncbi:hypothetical protein F4780DRAFT_734134 [Xylariomycetidae sp. FL0641]|nr:hypothetical protein F4780DRAFT_734134 [Xylariomycetidae sp. FL0641]
MVLNALPKRFTKALGAVVALALLAFVFHRSYQSDVTLIPLKGYKPAGGVPPAGPSTYNDKRLHLLVPATSTNYHLCQLLISAAILGYPAPVLINWGLPEDADEYVQHLAKVEGVLNYTNSLPPEQQDDLIFMLDGYDAWFQLPADVMVKRYYDVVAEAARRHVVDFGAEYVQAHGIRDTVLFGPDKLCWPVDPNRAACWAVPDAHLPERAFGPDTDHGIIEHHRARWLNSGTIMGPVREVRDVFAATLARIHDNFSTNSDQFYFAEVFAAQSYRRKLLKLQRDRELGLDVTQEEQETLPHLNDEREFPSVDLAHEEEEGGEVEKARYEYFIGLDVDSVMWQTVAFYEDYLTWVRHNVSTQYVLQDSRAINPHHHFVLPEDLVRGSPLAAGVPQTAAGNDAEAEADANNLPPELATWADLPLLTNTVTKTVPPVVHFTGKKAYRDMWWPKNWFFPYQKQLLARLRGRGLHQVPGDAQDPAAPPPTTASSQDRLAIAGGWTFYENKLGWVSWDTGLCARYETGLQF